MADYLSLEEAAQKLGIPTDKLVQLRSQGEIRGFRDGTSWKFPENEIERLADDLAAGGGSGLLADSDIGLMNSSGGDLLGQGSSGNVIGGDGGGDGAGSDLEIGSESLESGSGGDSDVNLVASEGEGSDVAIVASDSDLGGKIDIGGDPLEEVDSADLQLEEAPVLSGGESGQLDIALDPKDGSTGPVQGEGGEAGSGSGSGSGSSGSEIRLDDISLDDGSDLSFTDPSADEDSGEVLIGGDEDSGMDVLGSDIDPSGIGSDVSGSQLSGGGASSLEMLGGQLEESAPAEDLEQGSKGADVLSELDLLSAEQEGSGLIRGDSENLLGSSGLGSSVGADQIKESDLAGIDDALGDDDELVIADDDDDLVISSAGSDISVAGDSGINLMSPSDSGLSLESEPLDLAGSSISALDLGAELSEGGSSGSGGSGGSDGSLVDFQADEEFQLSPSSGGIDGDIDSGSQVIEVEDSEAIAEPVDFGEAAFEEAEPMGADAFAADGGEGVLAVDEGEAMALDESAPAQVAPASIGYEVPFTLLQCVTLVMILSVMCLGGMLMTDLVRNMWTYTEPSAPVSSLTDSLISLAGW